MDYTYSQMLYYCCNDIVRVRSKTKQACCSHLVTTNCVSLPTAMASPPALLHSPAIPSKLNPFPMDSDATDALKIPQTSIPTCVLVTYIV